MPSGKQVLLSVLQKYSQTHQDESVLDQVSERVKSALCAHCSTSSDTIKKIEEMGWLSCSEDGEVIKQGLGISKPNVFLTDLFEELIENEKIPERIKNRFPNLTVKQYNLGLDMIWWLLSSLQYWEELSAVENHGVLEENEAEKLLAGCQKNLENFRKEPW